MFPGTVRSFRKSRRLRYEPETAEVLAAPATRGHVLGIASNFDRRLRGLVENMPAFRSVRYLVISSEVGWRSGTGVLRDVPSGQCAAGASAVRWR